MQRSLLDGPSVVEAPRAGREPKKLEEEIKKLGKSSRRTYRDHCFPLYGSFDGGGGGESV